MIKITMNFPNFKCSLTYVYNLFFLYINIVIIKIYAKYLYFKIFKIENMMTSRFVLLKKYKNKVDSNILYNLIN